MPEEGKEIARARRMSRMKWVDGELAGKTCLMGDTFSVADAYLFVVAGWASVGLDLSGLSHLSAFMARAAAQPTEQGALRAEGLVK